MADIKVTLGTLYNILRNEKKREDLQELNSSFFVDVVSYLREKKALLNSGSDEDELFASSEQDKLGYELRSIKRILKEIYEKREKKIIDIALNKSRTKSDIIDTSHMLREEKDFFNYIVGTLDKYRKGILLHLFKGELPFLDIDVKREINSEKEVVVERSTFDKFEDVEPMASEGSGYVDDSEEGDQEGYSNEEPEESNEDEKPETQESESSSEEEADKFEGGSTELLDSNFVKVKFLHPVPRFIWKNMKEYGPFSPGEETMIFPEVADLLVRKGRAEKV